MAKNQDEVSVKTLVIVFLIGLAIIFALYLFQNSNQELNFSEDESPIEEDQVFQEELPLSEDLPENCPMEIIPGTSYFQVWQESEQLEQLTIMGRTEIVIQADVEEPLGSILLYTEQDLAQNIGFGTGDGTSFSEVEFFQFVTNEAGEYAVKISNPVTQDNRFLVLQTNSEVKFDRIFLCE